MKNIIEIKSIVVFMRKKFVPIKLEIIVTLQVKIEVELILFVIIKSNRSKVILFHLFFTILMVTYLLKSWLIKRIIKFNLI